MTGVEYVRAVCKEKKVPIARLERELGYANGYLNPKQKKIPYDRAVQIAEYLDIDVHKILGVEPSPAPADTGYYTDPETAKKMQAIFDSPGKRMLFDAVDELSPEQVDALAVFVDSMRKQERGDSDEPC